MGSSHSVDILMNIKFISVGRTLISSARLSQPLLRGDTDADYGPRALLEMQIDDDGGDLSDVDDCHVDGPLEPPPLDDVYELDWNEPERHTAMKLEDFVEAARPANADSTRRTFVVMHLFSGRRRRHDLEHWMRVMCSALGLSLLMVSVDLEWDNGTLINIIFG